MAFAKLIAFDRPLTGISAPGAKRLGYTEAEVLAREDAAYHRGVDASRALADQQMVEVRADIEALGEGVFKRLGAIEPTLLAQLRDTLPGLALEIARRMLAGYEPPPEVVARICEEALNEIFPERENLELALAPRDAALLEKLNPTWLRRYPGLRIRAEANLAPGDCQVRSRFGLTDARIATKLGALEHALVP
ncbi:MAG: flagellar biosynthesis protein [Opitutaceae bacterium]|nr:flagellar biosynthesis protein [Opitutaceae bacterium]